MIGLRNLVRRLLAHEKGSMVIETAFVAPVLVILALGGFEVSKLVSRQTELQSAAAEAAAVVRATIPETSEDRTTLRDIIMTSTGLSSWQVFVFPVYRCSTDENYVLSEGSCESGDHVSEYVRVAMFDTYRPVWANFGMGGPISFSVRRTIQVG